MDSELEPVTQGHSSQAAHSHRWTGRVEAAQVRGLPRTSAKRSGRLTNTSMRDTFEQRLQRSRGR